MKNSLACGKCQSRVVWCIEKLRAPDGYSNTLGDPMSLAKNRGGANGIATIGAIDLWVCGACGYSELWSNAFEALHEDPKNGIRRFDTRPGQGQYR